MNLNDLRALTQLLDRECLGYTDEAAGAQRALRELYVAAQALEKHPTARIKMARSAGTTSRIA